MVGMLVLLIGPVLILVFGYLDGLGSRNRYRRAIGKEMSTPRSHEITGMSANRVICKCGWNYKLDNLISLTGSRAQDLLLDNWNEHGRQVRGIK